MASHTYSKQMRLRAERLALPTSDQRVAGWNPAGGKILPDPKRRFIAQPFMFTLPSSRNDWNIKSLWDSEVTKAEV